MFSRGLAVNSPVSFELVVGLSLPQPQYLVTVLYLELCCS